MFNFMDSSFDNNIFPENINKKYFSKISPLYWSLDDENPFIFNGNFMRPLKQDEFDEYIDAHNYSNESNFQEEGGYNNNGNFIKSNKIGKFGSYFFGIKEENEKDIPTQENSNQNRKEKLEIIIENSPIFQTKRANLGNCWRFDSAKKYWKAKISTISTDFINKKIKESDLPKKYKKKIHKPNSLLFTANVKESDNCVFLEKDLRTIFKIGKENNALQKKNEYNILKIYEYFEKVGYNNLSDKMLEIKNFFEMRYEDLIKKFYESDEFINFKKEKETIFFDKGTKKQEGFAISEEFGLIRLFDRKRKRQKD